MLGEAHNPRRAVDFARELAVNNHVCNVTLALQRLSVKELPCAREGDAAIIARNGSNVVLHNAITQEQPSGLLGCRVSESGVTVQKGAIALFNLGPTHEFMNSEELNKGRAGSTRSRRTSDRS